MIIRSGRIVLTAAVALALTSLSAADSAPPPGSSAATAAGYTVTATDGSLIPVVTGEVMADVQGVPAQPVDAFNWDGQVEAVVGSVRIAVDPVTNTGTIKARWTDRNGQWQLTQTAFAPPDHAAGLRVGPSADETQLVTGDPITTDVYLHGDTTAGGPVLPTLFNKLATWGPAEVRLNGKPFLNPYDGPAPRWATHTMTSIGARLPDGTVTANEGTDIYNPMLAGQGDTQPDDLEVHVVFHDAPGPEPVAGNVPPPFSFFYHLQFEDVRMTID